MAAVKQKTNQANIVKPNAPQNGLLPVNPLLQSQVITVNEENEQKLELVEEVQNLSVLNKQVLEAKRRQVQLEVDNKKLDAANKIIDGINDIADKALTDFVQQKTYIV